jgi:hypothetical protein
MQAVVIEMLYYVKIMDIENVTKGKYEDLSLRYYNL